MFTAISVVLMILASAFPNVSLTVLAICGVVSAFALSECGYRYALLMYISVSVLSAIFIPDKSCVVLYSVLFGIYPLLKLLIERTGRPWLSWIIKLIAANALAYLALYIALTFLTSVGKVLIMGHKYFFVFYNLAVILYDICIGRLMLMYSVKRFGSGRAH